PRSGSAIRLRIIRFCDGEPPNGRDGFRAGVCAGAPACAGAAGRDRPLRAARRSRGGHGRRLRLRRGAHGRRGGAPRSWVRRGRERGGLGAPVARSRGGGGAWSGRGLRAATLFLPATLKVTGPAIDRDRQHAYVEKAFDRLARLGVEVVVFGSGGARRVPDGF